MSKVYLNGGDNGVGWGEQTKQSAFLSYFSLARIRLLFSQHSGKRLSTVLISLLLKKIKRKISLIYYICFISLCGESLSLFAKLGSKRFFFRKRLILFNTKSLGGRH